MINDLNTYNSYSLSKEKFAVAGIITMTLITIATALLFTFSTAQNEKQNLQNTINVKEIEIQKPTGGYIGIN